MPPTRTYSYLYTPNPTTLDAADKTNSTILDSFPFYTGSARFRCLRIVSQTNGEMNGCRKGRHRVVKDGVCPAKGVHRMPLPSGCEDRSARKFAGVAWGRSSYRTYVSGGKSPRGNGPLGDEAPPGRDYIGGQGKRAGLAGVGRDR